MVCYGANFTLLLPSKIQFEHNIYKFCTWWHTEIFQCLTGQQAIFMSCVYVHTDIECGERGSTVVKILCYKSEGRWFDSRRIFLLT
jgi:hypothetical protein